MTRSKPLKQAWVKGKKVTKPTSLPENLKEVIKNAAVNYPDKCLHFIDRQGQEQALTYQALYACALNVAKHLQQGASWSHVGKPVIIVADCLKTYAINFWGVILAGGQPATINAPHFNINEETTKLVRVWEQLNQPPVICCDQGQKKLIHHLMSESSMTLIVPNESAFGQYRYIKETVIPSQAAIVQLSSGSTGMSKCIQQSHRAIIEYCYLITQTRRQKSEHVSLNWMGFDHVGGLLFTLIRDTFLGCSQVHANTQWVLESPLRWLALMSDYQATHSWCPNFAYKLVIDSIEELSNQQTSLDLSHVVEIINAGEMAVAQTIKTFAHTFHSYGLKTEAITPSFGMAESCTAISLKQITSLDDCSITHEKILAQNALASLGHSEFVSLGSVVAETEIRIVDEQNQVLPEYHIGRMQLKGPSISMGYWQNESLNQKVFVGDGWFDTGDHGLIAEEELYITGRTQESLVVNGVNFFSHDIEACVEQVHGVKKTCAAVVGYQDEGDASVVFYVPESTSDTGSITQKIKSHLSKTLQFYPKKVVALSPRQFLKTTSGKIQRKKMLESWLNEQTLLANAIGITSLCWTPIFVEKLNKVSPLPLEVCLELSVQNTETIAIESDVFTDEQLFSLSRWLLQQTTNIQKLHLFVLVNKANSVHALKQWALAIEASMTDVTVSVCTRHDSVTQEWLLPDSMDSGCYHFDGMLWHRESEYPVIWRELAARAPVALYTNKGYSIITGASGGIATHLIESLVQQGEFVVLISRSKPAVLERLNNDNYLWLSVDFSDHDAFTDNWANAQSQLRRLSHAPTRIYHLAGSLKEDSLDTITEQSLSVVRSANIGVLDFVLDTVKRFYADDKAHIVVFGSVNGVRGGGEYLSYNLAHAGMRDRCLDLRAKGHTVTWLGWSAWKDTGMSVNHVNSELLQAVGLQLLEPQDCLTLLFTFCLAFDQDFVIGVDHSHQSSQAKTHHSVLSHVEKESISDIRTQYYKAPQSDLEKKVCLIWQTVLKTEQVGINNNFFSLGGNSILATKLIAQMNKQCHVSIALSDLLSDLNIEQLLSKNTQANKSTNARKTLTI